MKMIEAYHEILDINPITGKELPHLEIAGRNCHKSEDNISEDGKSAERLISMIIREGHESVLEHKFISVRFVCDRAMSHELVRHRIAAYCEESQRYCNYSKGKFNAEITFIRPWWLSEDTKGYSDFVQACQNAEDAYFDLLNEGWYPENARGVLPNATKTDIIATMNYREWRHVLKERCSIRAHVDMRQMMSLLALELQKKIPIIFDDIKVYPPFNLKKEGEAKYD